MRVRNRTVFSKLVTKGIFFLAERLLGTIPVIGPIFKIAMFVFA